MEGRQFAVIGLLWALALGVLGLRVCRAFAAPLLYLVFLVPFGGFAVPMLQALTARMIEWGLLLLEIPHHMDGLLIETRAGFFHVAEACAGLRFIVAALAFGALYAFTMYRSPGRRIAVMALALLVPIIANGLRALGIVVLAEHLGSAEAAAADHVIYGWGFFSVIILLLIAAGLPFRQDGTPDPVAVPTREAAPRAAARAAALLAVLGIAAAGPAGAAALDNTAGLPERSAAALAAPAECVAEGTLLRCDGVVVSAELLVFPARVTWATVAAERRRAQSGSDEDQTYGVTVPGRVAWQVRQHADGSGVTATATWLGGQPAGDGLKSRARQGLNSLGGTGGRPVMAAVSIAQPYPRARVAALLEAQSEGLVARAAALSVR
jgi:exosortase